jgi:hypothetical protein
MFREMGTLIIFLEGRKWWDSSLWNFSLCSVTSSLLGPNVFLCAVLFLLPHLLLGTQLRSGNSNFILPAVTPLSASYLVQNIQKKKRIPSIFNDESTGSFICLALSAFLCFLTSSMPVSGSMVLYRITPQSGLDHDFVSVVKILLKASPHSFLQHTYDYVTCSKVNARSSQTSSDVTIWRCGAQRYTIMK